MADLTLEQLVSKVEDIYRPLEGRKFQGYIEEKDTIAVCTGGRRDIIVVEDDDVCEIMETIKSEIEELSEDAEDEIVWKGITGWGSEWKLWVKSYDGPDTQTFIVEGIKVVTDLNWQKDYKAMVNITVCASK